ncbi:hypothetical protein [Streptomyces sp. NPDC102490]|uniref:hypothetical protein n=1 Tax=Streptomyces sp. NPDC102490 TaxID=3366183 RepID=UPI0037F8F076
MLLERLPSQSAEDAGFEERYADHVTARYGTLTIYGLDAGTQEWPLDTAYLSLELAALRELGGRPRVQVAGVMRAEELLAGLLPGRLTHLWLNAELPDTDVSWLTGFPRLRVLRVNPRLPRVRNVPDGVEITA